MTNIQDYYISGVTIGMATNNATKIISENPDIIESSYKSIGKAISSMTIEILKALCDDGLIPKKPTNINAQYGKRIVKVLECLNPLNENCKCVSCEKIKKEGS